MGLINPLHILLYAVNIVVLYFIIRRFLYKPIMKYLDARKAQIAENIDAANLARSQAEEEKSKYDSLIANSNAAAAEILTKSRAEAQKNAQVIFEQAKTDSRAMITRAAQAIEIEKSAAIAGAKTEIAALAVDLASKILSREIRQDDNERIIDDFFENMGEVDEVKR